MNIIELKANAPYGREDERIRLNNELESIQTTIGELEHSVADLEYAIEMIVDSYDCDCKLGHCVHRLSNQHSFDIKQMEKQIKDLNREIAKLEDQAQAVEDQLYDLSETEDEDERVIAYGR